MEEFRCEARADVVRFEVRVSPRASDDRLAGAHDGALRVRVTAPPVDGEANAAVIALLAKRLGVSKQRVSITAGLRGRTKRVEVRGVSLADVRALSG